jgi:hypothetical protein
MGRRGGIMEWEEGKQKLHHGIRRRKKEEEELEVEWDVV